MVSLNASEAVVRVEGVWGEEKLRWCGEHAGTH
jgi:hypothetical protein